METNDYLIIRNRQLPIIPWKINWTASLIRRKKIDKALEILRSLLPQKGSKILYKILQGAYKHISEKEEKKKNPSSMINFYIAKILVGPGRTRKKISIRAKGRSDLIRSRSTHLSIKLERKI